MCIWQAMAGVCHHIRARPLTGTWAGRKTCQQRRAVADRYAAPTAPRAIHHDNTGTWRMEKYSTLVSAVLAAGAVTALAAPTCAAQERPAARYDIAAWVESYRRGLPEPPARTQPKTHPPEPGKSVGLPPPLPERVGATGALPDDRLPADQVRPSPSQGGDQ